MKNIAKQCVLIILNVLVLSACGQNNTKKTIERSSDDILASKDGYTYTSEHFQQELQFLEFILGVEITEAEKQEGLEETLSNFDKNPSKSIQEVENIDEQMQQVYQLTDPYQIALVRSAFISQLYMIFEQMNEETFFAKVLNKYVPVLIYDQENMLAFTEQDFQGYLTMLQLNSLATGIQYSYSETEIQQFREALVQQFYYASVADRQSMCVMSVMAQYMLASYNQLSDVEKQAWKEQIINQQAYQYQNYYDQNDPFMQGYNQAAANATLEPEWPAGVNTQAEKQAYLQQYRNGMNANAATYGIMNDMMMNNHATMLNTIENFGNTGNYWEVKY
ncbi:MAG: hypothetical protein JXR36_00615 [Bacteroidales bacterium]|nr:hypothetical protein [Bacteroidales bacterium]